MLWLQILVALRYYATGDHLSVIGDTFGIHKSTVSRSITEVTEILASKFNDYIKWPNADERKASKSEFYRAAGFPAVVGKCYSAYNCYFDFANVHSNKARTNLQSTWYQYERYVRLKTIQRKFHRMPAYVIIDCRPLSGNADSGKSWNSWISIFLSSSRPKVYLGQLLHASSNISFSVAPSCHRAIPIEPSCHRSFVSSCHRSIVSSWNRIVVLSYHRTIVSFCHRITVPLCHHFIVPTYHRVIVSYYYRVIAPS